MTTTETLFDRAKYQDQVNKLLRLAEAASTEQERESANAMAQRLMQKHSIDLAMIEAARTEENTKEEIVSEEFVFLGTLGEWHRTIAWAIVQSHDSARGVQHERKVNVRDEVTQEPVYTGTGAKRRRKTRHEFVLAITAFNGDLDQIRYLITSVRAQVVNGLEYYMKYTRPEQLSSFMLLNDDNGTRYRDKRQWLMSYASGLRTNLLERNRTATSEFVEQRATETNTETALVRQSVAVAVRSRRESVNDWMDNKYGGRLRAARGGNVAGGSGSASSSGFSSGRSANVSGAGSKAPRAIGR